MIYCREWKGEQKKKRVYIAGPITGHEGYLQEFYKAEEDLVEAGFEVINPARIGLLLPETYEHKEYMAVCMPLLDSCDFVYCLKGWEKSNGANMEVARALEKKKIITFQE